MSRYWRPFAGATILIILMVNGAYGQPPIASSSPPAGALVNSPPKGSQWHVTILYPDSGRSEAKTTKEPSAFPERLEMRFGTNGIVEGKIGYTDHSTRDFYVAHNQLIVRAANSGRVLIYPADAGGFSLHAFPFPAISWIKAEKFTGIVQREGTQLYKFETSEVTGETHPLDIPLSAWIDAQKRYPTKIDLGTVTYLFSPVTPFQEEIHLPPDYASALDRWSSEMSASEPRPSR